MTKKILAVFSLIVWLYILFSRGYLPPEKYFPAFFSNKAQPARPSARLPEKAKEPPFKTNEKFTFFYAMGPLRAGSAELIFLGETTTFRDEAAYYRGFL